MEDSTDEMLSAFAAETSLSTAKALADYFKENSIMLQ